MIFKDFLSLFESASTYKSQVVSRPFCVVVTQESMLSRLLSRIVHSIMLYICRILSQPLKKCNFISRSEWCEFGILWYLDVGKTKI